MRVGEPHDTLTAFGQATDTNVGLSYFGHYKITMHFPNSASEDDVLERLQEITAAIEAAEEVPDADE